MKTSRTQEMDFEELFRSILYDYGFSYEEQELNERDGDFYINKTYIQKKENAIIFTYKMEEYKVSEEAYTLLKEFYDNLYNGDKEFQSFLYFFEDKCFDDFKMFKKANNDTYTMKEHIVLYKDGKYHLNDKEISQELFRKISNFYELINNNVN